MDDTFKRITNENKDFILEQYKIAIESADKISERRTNINNYFLTLNTFLITILGSFLENHLELPYFILVCGLGILVSLFWIFNISSYKNLNSVKFKIIHKMEEEMPFKIFFTEWELLKSGNNKKKYRPFSHIEKWIPCLFIVLYCILIIIKKFELEEK